MHLIRFDWLTLLAFVLYMAGRAAYAADVPPFKDRGFIDHHNLRHLHPDEEAISSQVAEIKSNLNKAQEYGITHYVLFSRGFERLITYDFEIEGVGNIGAQAFPKDCDQRKNAAMYGKALTDALRYAGSKRIRLLFHTNQFEFPEQVHRRFGDRMGGTAKVCPGKEFVWQLFRGKIREFFTKFPACDGLQITADETQVSALACRCEACKDMAVAARVDRMIREAAAVCDSLGKQLQARTWGRVGELERERDPSRMLDDLPKGVIVSIKNTRGDFYLTEPVSNLIGFGRDRQVIEFDCWGEYFGWNNFPCYLGDVMAERMKFAAARGVRRVAARLCWNPFANAIFARPWGNDVNVYVYAKLAQDPALNPDDALREWIAQRYFPNARQAAMRLYKRSAALQRVWMTYRGRNANDHSRIFRRETSTFERVRSKLRSFISTGYRFPAEDLAERRRDIDAALKEAEALVSNLGPSVPRDWKDALLRGARIEWFVAHGVTDQMALLRVGLDAENGRPLPDLSRIEKRIHDRAKQWKESDPDAFEPYHGDGPGRMLREVRRLAEPRTSPDP